MNEDKETAAPVTIGDVLAPAGRAPIAIDAAAMARRELKKALPKRFYKEARAEPRAGAYALLLDGRPAKTPARNALALPTPAAAQELAAEWERQGALIDPGAMPFTRIVNSAIDGVAREIEGTIAEIARYGGSDLVCYRASEPEALAQMQTAYWDKVLDFARDKLGIRLICAQGVNFVEQPEPARRALREAVQVIAEEGGAFALAALHVMTTLTGSALLALAVAHQALTPEEAWAAAHVDEDFQMKVWGADAQALARRARRWAEMEAAARLLRAVGGAPGA